MIRATRQDYRLVVDGHAGYAEQGKDIVCAAASILFYTLRETLARHGIPHEASDGDARVIDARVDPAFSFDADMIFDTICTGYVLLADAYPDHVLFTDIS